MSTSLTLANARAEVRDQIDFGQNFVSDAELNGYLNRGRSILYDRLTEDNGDSVAVTETNITVTSATNSYALPADFKRVVGVYATYEGGIDDGERALRPASLNELKEVDEILDQSILTYRLEGGNIEFYPVPVEDATVRLRYIPDPATLASDGDTLECWTSNGLEYVIAYACYRCLLKQRDPDTAIFKQEAQDALEAAVLEQGGIYAGTGPVVNVTPWWEW